MKTQVLNPIQLTELNELKGIVNYNIGPQSDSMYIVTAYTLDTDGRSYSIILPLIANGIRQNCLLYDFECIDKSTYTYNEYIDKWDTIKPLYTEYHSLSPTWDLAYNTFRTSSGLFVDTDTAYPVGSIYITVGTTGSNPQNIFGGTWERFAQGRLLIGSNGTIPVMETGGRYFQPLSADELPIHRHTYDFSYFIRRIHGGEDDDLGYPGQVTNPNYAFEFGNTGNGLGPINATHNNIQPYIVAYIWRRTA